MKEFSEKELEQLYKEEILNDIPDLWKNIEGNLAPKNTTTNVVETKAGKGKKNRSSFRWLAGMAAVLVVALLAIPGWQLLQGGTKSYDNSSSAMESQEAEFQGEMDEAADLMGPAGKLDADGEQPSEPSEGNAGQAAKGEEDEFHLEVELSVVQVQTTMEGFLVTGEVLDAEEDWFEAGERVTLFYEGTAYGEEDFAGTLRVKLDVEEENLKILEILP